MYIATSDQGNSRKLTVAISGPRTVQTANSIEVLSLTADTSPNVATDAARKRDKRLRLATDELPENSRELPLTGLGPSERGTGHPACRGSRLARGGRGMDAPDASP